MLFVKLLQVGWTKGLHSCQVAPMSLLPPSSGTILFL